MIPQQQKKKQQQHKDTQTKPNRTFNIFAAKIGVCVCFFSASLDLSENFPSRFSTYLASFGSKNKYIKNILQLY